MRCSCLLSMFILHSETMIESYRWMAINQHYPNFACKTRTSHIYSMLWKRLRCWRISISGKCCRRGEICSKRSLLLSSYNRIGDEGAGLIADYLVVTDFVFSSLPRTSTISFDLEWSTCSDSQLTRQRYSSKGSAKFSQCIESKHEANAL